MLCVPIGSLALGLGYPGKYQTFQFKVYLYTNKLELSCTSCLMYTRCNLKIQINQITLPYPTYLAWAYLLFLEPLTAL